MLSCQVREPPTKFSFGVPVSKYHFAVKSKVKFELFMILNEKTVEISQET